MMHTFTATLNRFDEKGEKTGWTYIDVPYEITHRLKPGQKTSFRVKGTLDDFPIARVALVPMGEGAFIIAINAQMRQGIRKEKGATVRVSLELDESLLVLSEDLLACLEDDAVALAHFQTLSQGHQAYFSHWIEEAKTIETKTKRLHQAVVGLSMGFGFGEMIRHFKK